MKIRRAGIEDIPFIVEQEQLLQHSTLGVDFVTRELTNDFAYLYILTVDNKRAGYIATRIDEYCDILSLFITKEFQGKGFGRKLLDFTLNEMKSKGSKMCSLEVRESNNSAIALYTSCGFNLHSKRPRYYSNGEDAYYLIKEF